MGSKESGKRRRRKPPKGPSDELHRRRGEVNPAAVSPFRGWCRLALCLLLLSGHSRTAPAAPERWRADIDRLTADDTAHPPAPGGVVFVGSSSIRLWKTLAEDFPGLHVIRRGFGGSHLADTLHYADRIILPYAPSAVVVYAGENDLADGRTPEEVAGDFAALRTRIASALPRTRLIYLSVKLSPSRTRIHHAVRRTNALIKAACSGDPRCVFVDVATPMLAADGSFRPELYVGDRLHLSPAGYALWTALLAPHLRP